MAISKAGSCIDAAPASQGEYDVFLNFRGVDTRHGFTDFLYHGLKDAGVHVFRDEEKLPVGEVIGEKLQQAIKNTIIYMPIFSQTYVSSKWCLRELALMVNNMSESKGQKSIIPIFFHVEPDDVKFKKPLYEADFKKHEEDFPDEVKAWKRALRKVGEHKGWVVEKNTSQAMMVKFIVGKVLEKLRIKRKLVTEHLIGLDDRVKDLTEFLDVNHDDVRLIGIYGMGGIGKTTIAKAVFNHLYSHFGRSCSFLEDIRERSTKEGIVPLQKKLLSDIGGSEYVEKIYDSEEGMRRIGATLSNRKVLVVLDDVDKKVPIKNLIVNSKLSRGSRIIITTRDKDIPQVEESKVKIERYEMQTMDDGVALQLFCLHAFQKDYPLDDYRELSREILSLMGGLPLAIKVVGSLLKSKKDKKIWKDTLLKLRAVPKEEILEKLRISYNDLDKFQKEIFLDIACFFFNEKKADAIYMWESCKFYPREGIEVLTERCLIKILDNDKFWMHDQLIALGRQIVREDSQGDFGKQSRLWDPKEALQIIRTKEEKNEIQALEIHGLDGSMEITNEEFDRLQNLRFLNLGDGTFAGNFAKSHSKLRWISWNPDLRAEYMYLNHDIVFNNMYLDDLVVFKLGTNHFMGDSKAWDLIKRAQNLKVLSLTGCHGISTIPDISKCSGLERLTLVGCSSLKRIESFIGNLPSLIELKIEGCRDLIDLPEEIGALVKLEHFSLSGCETLRELPGSIENLTSLTELDLSDTIISKLPDSIGKLKSLRILRFPVDPLVGGEKYDWQLPSGISTLVNFEELDLSGHEELKGEIPIGIAEWSSLRILNLESTSICRIPSTINMLHHLQTLNLGDCHEIQELPELPTSLTCLHLESESLLSVPNLCKHTNLVELQLSDGSRLTRDSNLRAGCNIRWIGSLSKMKELDLNLQNVPVPPELASLSHLEELVLSFVILDCKVADILLKGLPRLEKLTVDNCKQLKTLSIPLKLRKLREVHVVWCKELFQIQVVGLLESLEHLRVYECESLKGISGLSYLKNLETLRIEMCNVLPDVEGLDKLESLKFLDVKKCMSLRSLIDASCTNIPDDCYVIIEKCGDSIKDCPRRKPLKITERRFFRIHQQGATSSSSMCRNFIKRPFTIIFVHGVKKYSEGFGFVGGTEWEIENVTYEGLIADVKGFGFRLERKWYKAPGEDCVLLIEIKSDEQVNRMVPLASTRGFVHLYVEGGFENDPSNAECLEATANRRQTRDERTGHDGIVDGGKTASMENRNKDKNMIGEPADKNDILRSRCQRGDGVEHNETSYEVTTQVEDPRGLYSIEGGEWATAWRTSIESCKKEKDGAEFHISGSNEVRDSASVGESETDGTSSIDDFQSKPGNTECFEAAMGNRRQMRDGRIGHYDNVDGSKTASMENRKKDKDEIGEPANPSDVEHFERSCKATTEVEDQRDVSSVLTIWELTNQPCPSFAWKHVTLQLHLKKRYLPGISSLLRNSHFLETLTFHVYPGRDEDDSELAEAGWNLAFDYNGFSYWSSVDGAFPCLEHQFKHVELIEFLLKNAQALEKIEISTKKTLQRTRSKYVFSSDIGRPLKGYCTLDTLLEFSQ